METTNPTTETMEQRYPEPETAVDPFAVDDEPAQREIDARVDAMIDARLRDIEEEEDEDETNEPDGDEDDFGGESTPKEKEILVVVFWPGQSARLVKIDNNLGTMQKLVGGLIEVFPVGVKGAIGVCNDDFIGEGLQPNRYIRATGGVICGPFFVAGDGYNMGSLTTRQIAEVILNL